MAEKFLRQREFEPRQQKDDDRQLTDTKNAVCPPEEVPTALIDIFGDENVSIFLLFISARTTLP
jgi:hypothetical protein